MRDNTPTPHAGPTMFPITFELCAETLAACRAASAGGAHRIELCSRLDAGGLTPDFALLNAVLAITPLPVHVMLRPRAGNFAYSQAEFSTMLHTLAHIRSTGAQGIVFGLLHADRTIDLARCRELIAAAAPLEVTFHRAFDETPDLPAALEELVTLGCHRILTSGGRPDVTEGAAVLRALVSQATDRIAVAIGGGLRLANAAALARTTRATHFHGSLRRTLHDGSTTVLAEDVRAVIAQLIAQHST